MTKEYVTGYVPRPSGASDAYSVRYETTDKTDYAYVPDLPDHEPSRGQEMYQNQLPPAVNSNSNVTPASVKVLEECIDLQRAKSQDYQNPNSNVVQAMYYRCGMNTLQDVIQTKLLRAQSLLEAAEASPDTTPNFESLEDTYKDLINYASFAVAWLRGEIPGQKEERDIFNKKIW